MAPGDVLVQNLGSGLLPSFQGELGIYKSSSFTSSSAIEDYVSWGANGVRDSVAAGAGIWINGEFIAVAGITTGQTLQLLAGGDGNSAADYTVSTSSLGSVNTAPEHATCALLFGIASFAALWRRRRRA